MRKRDNKLIISDTWQGAFKMRTQSFTESETIDWNENMKNRRVKLECGHEFEIENVETGADYHVTCTECKQQCLVIKEKGGGSISYRFVYQCR